MEMLYLKRLGGATHFDRRKLKKVKDVPRDQLHALVDKVEIASNFNAESKVNRCMLRIFATGIFILVTMSVMAAVHQKDDTQSQTISDEQLETFISQQLVQNSSSPLVQKLMQQKEDLSKRSRDESTSGVEDDEKTAQFLAKAFQSIDKKTNLPKLVLALILWFIAGPLIYFAKLRQDNRKAFKNISTLLNIENDLYFCKKGYLWSIDHNVSRLKLTKTHCPAKLEQLEDSQLSLREFEAMSQQSSSIIRSDIVQTKMFDEEAVSEEKPKNFPKLQAEVIPQPETQPLLMQNTMSMEIPQPQMMMGQPGLPQSFFPYSGQVPLNYFPMGYYGQYPMMYPYHPQMIPIQPQESPVDKTENVNSDTEETESAVEADSPPISVSKHRSYAKKRKLNQISGSVNAKFSTAVFALRHDRFG